MALARWLVDLHCDPKFISINSVLELEWPEASWAGTDAARMQRAALAASSRTNLHIRRAKVCT